MWAICRYLATDYNKPKTPIQKVQSMFETSGWKLGCPSINHNWRIRRRQNPLLVDGKEQVVYKWSWSTAIPGASAMGISITCNAHLTSLARGVEMGWKISETACNRRLPSSHLAKGVC
jgi:hypothetical protein